MKRNKIFMLVCISIAIMSCKPATNETESNKEEVPAEVVVKVEEPSLFERLGGEEGISSIVDGIIDAHLKNAEIAHVFESVARDEERFNTFKTHVKQFLSSGTGGNAEYMGKDIPTAHKGLNISEREFIAAIDDILMVLSQHNIDEETKKDMLYILYSMKGAVIGL